jgi:uncharacterized membrane protein YcaP (DUF421 family)
LFALSPLGLFIRGSVVCWFLSAIFRVVLRRDIGKIVYRKLRRECITEDDLRAKLREQGGNPVGGARRLHGSQWRSP